MSEKAKKKPSAPFLSEDSEACFNHFSPLVAATPVAELEPWNADPDIVRVNVERGADAIRPHLDHVAKALPLVSVDDLLELPPLALALGFAADRVFTPASPQEIRTRQQRLRPTRQLTLAYLEIAAELGLVAKDRVIAIRANKGAIDEASDGIAIVALFRENSAALTGKHPFPEPTLTQLAEDGNWLRQQLLPGGATPEKTARSEDSLARDRLWTELVRRYDNLYQAGVAVWGRRKVDEHVPALLSRVATAGKAGAGAGAPVTPVPAGAGPGKDGG